MYLIFLQKKGNAIEYVAYWRKAWKKGVDMQRLVARACLGVNGDDVRSVRESGGARQHPSSKALERGRLKTLGYSEHSDETPFTLYACLSLNLHSCADGTVPL